MKTNSAVCKLTLWTSKKLKNGSSPIVLTIRFRGQSLISTGFSCFPKDWNERQQCLKKTFPNSAAINGILLELLNRANAIRIELDGQGIDYTHKQIAERIKNNQTSSKPKTFKQVMEDMFEKRSLAVNSRSIYHTAYLSISRFLGNPNFLPSDVNDKNIKEWAEHCSNKCCINTMLNYLYKISTTLTYASKIGVTFNMPVEGLDYIHSHYKIKVEHRNLQADDILKLEMHFESTFGVNEGLLQRTSKQFVLAFFLCSYQMQGLAPVDMLQLKSENVTETTVNGIDVYKIVTNRQKTKVPLTIIVPKMKLAADILKFLLESTDTRDGYVFPVFYADCDKNKLSRTFNTCANKHLAALAKQLGIKPFTCYSARHSYATNKIREGANIGLLANALGRSVANIGVYISNLSSDEDLTKLSIL